MSQSTFRTALLDPAQPEPPGLHDPQGRPAGRRFAVYRNNVAVALTDALVASFPALQTLVGEEFFRAMAGVFLRRHPPQTPVLADWGEAMPAFLAGFPPLADFPYLPDVARLELALRRSYHTADSVPVAPEAFAAIPPEALGAMRLTLAPAVQVLRSPWPLLGIWGGAADPGEGPQDVLVTRPVYDPVAEILPPGGADFLSALNAGQPLAPAIEAAGDEFDFPATLSLLLAGGAIIAITAGELP
ncbi:MAG: DUF2063 domain-containing protein [Rhodobacteraceae bacterium]|nr:DUF2063 domain-containing protein [Paracoccaceae bacterium]